MKLNLKQIFNITGESRDIDFSILPEEIGQLKGVAFVSPLAVKGRVYNRADLVTLEYTADLTLRHTCDRCLSEFERSYNYDFSHIVVPSVSNDNDEYIVAEDMSIDLNEIVISDSLLQLPSKILCREDCRGICPVCYCNLNETDCNCLKNSEHIAQ